MKDIWQAGNFYDPYVGRWSRLVAKELLAWLAIDAGKAWLDVGCGTGALTEAILHFAQPVSVMAIDLSPDFIDYARANVSDPRATFQVGDAQSLPVKSGTADVAASGLVLNFVPVPALAASEMARAVCSGGIVAVYVWDYAEQMEMMQYFWDAAKVIDKTAAALDEGSRFPLCRPQALAELFERTGLTDVEVRAIDIRMRFRDFEDYWSPFLGGQGPAPAYAMSLAEDDRSALRERLRATLPIAGDGSINLRARAWAVRGRVV